MVGDGGEGGEDDEGGHDEHRGGGPPHPGLLHTAAVNDRLLDKTLTFSYGKEQTAWLHSDSFSL